ncbi:MAG: mechanosensitive ion channel family protein, partial [Cystobacter sp.]
MHRHLFILLLVLLPLRAFALNEGLGETPLEVDRQTPLATVEGFLDAAHARYMALLPHYLWLSHLPKEQQQAEGERLGRRLMFVLDRALWFDFARLSQEPQGEAPGATSVSLGQVPLGRGTRDIRLRRVAGADGSSTWVFSEGTVRAIDALFEEHGSPLL